MDDSKIQLYTQIGFKDKDWYYNHQLEFEKLFGKERLPLVCKLFAATSINSSLKSNIRLFRKALHEIDNGKEFSNYLPVMKSQLERVRAGDELSGRKITNFAAALSGDTQAVVVDIWLLRAFAMDRKYIRKESQLPRSGGASDKQYTEIETYVKEKAFQKGLEPRQLSAIIWAGVRIFQTGDHNTKYLEILKHQLYNMYEMDAN